MRVFLAMSLDGFVAGPDNDLSWLHRDGVEDTYAPFFATVGSMLMGRNTHDVVAAMEGVPWPYGDTPVLVATHRPLAVATPTVRAVAGPIETLIADALLVADGKDVYVDGAEVARAALNVGCVDTLTITIVPVILGGGVSLFSAGGAQRHELTLESARPIGGGLVQLKYLTKARITDLGSLKE